MTWQRWSRYDVAWLSWLVGRHVALPRRLLPFCGKQSKPDGLLSNWKREEGMREVRLLFGIGILIIFGMLLAMISLPSSTPEPVATIIFVDDTPTSTVTPVSFICTPLPTSTPEATQTPTATPHVGSVIIHAWIDETNDQLWSDAVERVEAEVLFIGREPVPSPYARYWSIHTDGTGIAVNGKVYPGNYDIQIIGLPNGNFMVPYYDNIWRVTVKADDQSMVNLRFTWWRSTWTPTASVTATRPATSTPTASVTPTVTATPIATRTGTPTATLSATGTVTVTPTSIPYACINYWTYCRPVGEQCPIGTVPDLQGQCGQNFFCCRVMTTPTQ